MLTVEGVQVLLDASLAPLEEALREANRKLDSFERNAGRLGRGIGAGLFGGLTAAVGGFTGALVGALTGPVVLGGFRQLRSLVEESIGASAEQQDAVRRLDAALARLGESARSTSQGLQEYAGQLQDSTKFGDEEVVLAEARIAAFVKEEEAIKSLTAAAADFATARGIGLSQAAELIGRTVGGSGNALRRFGIEVQGVAGSAQRAESAIAGLNARFGGQAIAAGQTYTGVITRLRNAFGDAQESIGDLVTRNGLLLEVLQQQVLPAIKRFSTFLADNRLEIQALVVRAVPALINALGSLLGVVARIVEGLGFLRNSALSIQGTIAQLNVSFQKIARFKLITGFSQDDLDAIAQAEAVAASYVEEAARAELQGNQWAASISAAADAVRGLGAEVAKAIEGREAFELPDVVTPSDGGEPATDEQIEGLETVQKKLREIQVERLKAVDPLRAELALLQDEIAAVQKLELEAAEEPKRARLLAELADKRWGFIQRIQAAEASQPQLLAAVNEQLARLAELDPAAAAQFANEIGQRVAAAVGPEGKSQELAKLAQELALKIEEEAGPKVGSILASGLTQGIQSALSGSQNALQAFGAVLQQVGESALATGFTKAAEQLGTELDKVFSSSVAGLGGILTGIFGAVLGAAFNKTEVTSAAGNIQSAVTSAQQVRGIVAGPSQIAIAQVGESIRDAFAESERLLTIIARNTTTLATGRGTPAGAAPAAFDAAFSLANESPSLA